MQEDKFSISKFLKIDSLKENLKGYIDTRAKLFQIEIEERVTELIVNAVTAIFMSLVGLLCFFFISIGLAIYIGKYTGGSHVGFLLFGGVYLILFLIGIRLKKSAKFKEFLNKTIFAKATVKATEDGRVS